MKAVAICGNTLYFNVIARLISCSFFNAAKILLFLRNNIADLELLHKIFHIFRYRITEYTSIAYLSKCKCKKCAKLLFIEALLSYLMQLRYLPPAAKHFLSLSEGIKKGNAKNADKSVCTTKNLYSTRIKYLSHATTEECENAAVARGSTYAVFTHF